MRLLSFVFLSVIMLRASVPDAIGQVNFQKTFTFDGQQMVPADMALSSDSGFVTAMNAFYDCYVTKFNSQGTFVWKKKFSSPAGAVSRSIRRTLSNGYLLSTYFTPGITQGTDLGLIKLDSLGNVFWAKAYGTGNSDFGYDAIEISNGNILLAGSSVLNNRQLGSMLGIQGNGTLNWSVAFDDTASNGVIIERLLELTDGNIVLSGYSSYGSQTVNAKDGFLIKSAPNGTMIWNKVYHFPEWGNFTDVMETSDGGLIVSGIIDINQDGINNRDFFLMRTDSIGGILWAKAYTRDLDDLGNRVLPLSDGGFLITGSLNTLSSASTAIIKVNSSGVVQWTNQFPCQNSSPSGNVTLPAPGNGFYTFSTRQIPPLIQGYVIKTGNLGLGFCNDSTASVIPSNVNLQFNSPIKSVTMTGVVSTVVSLSGANPVYNETTLCIPSGIDENNSIEIASCFPNPSANGFFQISVTANAPKFECFDLCGKVVAFDQKPIGENNYSVQLFSPGCYILRVSTAYGSKSVKLMVTDL